MGSSNRIEYIDLAKGICILLVVTLHVAPEIGAGYSFLTCLRMPLYYCLSGLFFKTYGNFSNFLVKKSDKLLIPFLAWYVISYLIYYSRVILIGEPEHIFRITDLFLEPEFYNGSIWFLLSLFWCNLLYFGINKIAKKLSWQLFLVGILALAGWIWSYADFNNFLYIGTSLTCLPFFFIGRQLISLKIISNEKNIKKDLIIAALALGVAMVCILIPEQTVFMRFYLNHMDAGNPLTLYITSFALVILTLVICKYIGKIPYISYLGRFSIIVLVTHGLINNIINRSVRHLIGVNMDDFSFHLILLAVIIISMALIIPLCRKFLPYITAQKNFIEEKLKDSRLMKLISFR